MIDENEARFARWMTGLGGWAHTDSATLPGFVETVERWDTHGLIVRDGNTLRLTPAGEQWCRENGVG